MDIDKDFPPDEEDEVKVKLENKLDELSNKRISMLGYYIYRKCSLGEPVSNEELTERLSKISKRYPGLTLDKLINECKLKDKPDKITLEDPYVLRQLDIISEENILPEDAIRHILPKYLKLEKRIIYYSNGYINEEYTHINGIKQGTYKRYRFKVYNGIGSQGSIEIEANYKDDILHGKYIEYRQDSEKEMEANYKDGKLDGKYIDYDLDGNKKIESTYKDGKLNGKYIKFSRNGSIIVEQNFKDNILDGNYIHYSKDGNKDVEIYYEDGIPITIKEWYPSGQIKKIIKNTKYGIPKIKAWKEDGSRIRFATLKTALGML
jgi:antitoxin component YwqK of YwqJK toxin-antitoxin module